MCRGSTLFPTFSVLDDKTLPAGMSTLITELFTAVALSNGTRLILKTAVAIVRM